MPTVHWLRPQELLAHTSTLYAATLSVAGGLVLLGLTLRLAERAADNCVLRRLGTFARCVVDAPIYSWCFQSTYHVWRFFYIVTYVGWNSPEAPVDHLWKRLLGSVVTLPLAILATWLAVRLLGGRDARWRINPGLLIGVSNVLANALLVGFFVYPRLGG